MKIRAHLVTTVLALTVAAVAVPAALGGVPRDGRSPDTKDAAIAAHSASSVIVAPVDGRSPDTVDAALAAQGSSLVPLDGRSPDTVDAALQAHSPVVTIVRSSGFDWGDFGIGFAAAVGSLLLLAGLGAGLIAARQSQKAGPATTA